MTFTFLITAAVLIILLIIPQIMKRVVYKKLTGYLSERDYEQSGIHAVKFLFHAR